MNYLDRVNRALDHVVRHLADSLRLEEVSTAAGFSPFHFHRVFKRRARIPTASRGSFATCLCRYDVALVVDEVEPEGGIGRFEFPPMRVAEVVVSGSIERISRSLVSFR